MLTLIIGNRTYSSWSLRGWLACKASALPFETVVVPMDTPGWNSGTAKARMPSGKVPVLWDGEVAVWDSLAIIDWLAERTARDRFWPESHAASALARSMAAEMHSGFQALRSGCSMNLQRDYPDYVPTPEVLADVARVDALWTEARTRFGDGGAYLFGEFGAADIMFAPVVTRCKTFGLPLAETAAAYRDAMLAHPWMAEWTADARAETYPFNRDYFAALGGVAGGIPAR